MAEMEAQAIEAIIRADPRGGEVDRPALAATLRRVRERGYAVSRNERVLGATAIAVPLRDETGAAPYRLTMAGPTTRLVAREDAQCATTLAAATAISVRLGNVAAPRAKARAAT